MRLKVYASIDQLGLYNKGIKAGMSEEASDYLSHLEEIEIDLLVEVKPELRSHRDSNDEI